MEIKNINELKSISRKIRNLRINKKYNEAISVLNDISNIDGYLSLLNQKISILADLEEFSEGYLTYQKIKEKDEYTLKSFNSLERKLSKKVKDLMQNGNDEEALKLLDEIELTNPILINQKFLLLIKRGNINQTFEFYYSLESMDVTISKKFLLYKGDLIARIENLFEKNEYEEAILLLKEMCPEKDYIIGAKLIFAYNATRNFRGALEFYYSIKNPQEYLKKRFIFLLIELSKEANLLYINERYEEVVDLIKQVRKEDIDDVLEGIRFKTYLKLNDWENAKISFKNINNPKKEILNKFPANILIENIYAEEIFDLKKNVYVIMQRNNKIGSNLFDKVDYLKKQSIMDENSLRYIKALFSYFNISKEKDFKDCGYSDRNRNFL